MAARTQRGGPLVFAVAHGYHGDVASDPASDRFADRNVLGGTLLTCSNAPRTGFFRDGCCNTGPDDHGLHVVCARMTGDFLRFARAQGNDLVTPVPEYRFPGLKPGDRWCVCAATWRQAYEAGVAPPVVLEATHEETLAVIPMSALKELAVDG